MAPWLTCLVLSKDWDTAVLLVTNDHHDVIKVNNIYYMNKVDIVLVIKWRITFQKRFLLLSGPSILKF